MASVQSDNDEELNAMVEVKEELDSDIDSDYGEFDPLADFEAENLGQEGDEEMGEAKFDPDKPFNCTVCNKGFARKKVLDVHMRTHTDVRQYQCGMCDKAFRQSAHLRAHERIHTGEISQ